MLVWEPMMNDKLDRFPMQNLNHYYTRVRAASMILVLLSVTVVDVVVDVVFSQVQRRSEERAAS